MRKLIAAMNMTLDGFCDHTAMIADDEIHQHYTDLLNSAGTVLYGRITYQLMEYWRSVLENPTGKPAIHYYKPMKRRGIEVSTTCGSGWLKLSVRDSGFLITAPHYFSVV
jgi:hypothetical protein